MHKTIEQIAKELVVTNPDGSTRTVTKQNVNQTLKRAMRKVYKKTRKVLGEDGSPFEAVVTLAKILGVKKEKDMQHFFHDFPKDVRKEVIESMIDRVNIPNGWTSEDFLKKNLNGKPQEAISTSKPKNDSGLRKLKRKRI